MNMFAGAFSPNGSVATSTNPALLTLDGQQADTIRIARVLCIIFMMSTHAWPGGDRMLAANVPAISSLFYLVVVDLLGRASVPLLSFVSGMLLVFSLQHRSAGSVISGKVRTLLLPMILWSIPMLLVLAVKQQLAGPGAGSTAPSLLDKANLLFALTAAPANGPLHFLREIFVMVLYGTVILKVMDRSKVAGCLVALGVVLVEQMPGGFLLLRSTIATMFVAGLLTARFGLSGWTPSWPLVGFALLALFTGRQLGLLVTAPEPLWAMRLSEHLPKVALGLFAWRVCGDIAQSHGRLRRLCDRLEPHIFVIFCSHALVASVFGLAAALLGWSEHHAAFPLLLLFQLAAFVAIGTALSLFLGPFPWLRGARGRRAGIKSPFRLLPVLQGRLNR